MTEFTIILGVLLLSSLLYNIYTEREIDKLNRELDTLRQKIKFSAHSLENQASAIKILRAELAKFRNKKAGHKDDWAEELRDV
jgi:predicted  nucleic acid-binding Zn-ribbon protein